MRSNARVAAVLGPTNTGKTHYAIERMLAHRTGVIGLPLRLLAREVYDRLVAARGPSVVALVTGEERIVPERTAYWVCTTEAMPQEIGADFVAVDEIQLCADPERGHVFTDRLLHARGLRETLFLGSDTMRPAIAALVPGVTFMARPRLSELTWAGWKKISRLPARTAIVGFSVENVYAIAELIRRTKGGCAVVMGALSPRTRNAQVALYQNGDVDYLVATDAIGMGLNLDIDHVAFSATVKFDGRRTRALYPWELAQIAGRAGRHMRSGTFGVTGEARPLAPEVIAAIESHRFLPVAKLHWRNTALDFGTVERLIASLETPTGNEWLMRARDTDDLRALKALADMPEVMVVATGPHRVRLLWDICRIPDFRSISPAEHAALLAQMFDFRKSGPIPAAWLARNIARIDRTDGDIDALSRRLAFIRTWTYVAQRSGWVEDENHWRAETRAVEDRLSDALHARLTQRFVDRRTSVLLRRLKQKESLVAEVGDKDEVRVEGEYVGRLDGFRFRQDGTNSPDEARTLRQAAYEALRPEFILRADRFYNAPDTAFDYTEQGGLMWGNTAVGKLVKGPESLRPQVEAFVDEEAGPDVADKVRRRLQHFIDRRVMAQFEPLLKLSQDEALTGLARGFAFRLVEAMGVLQREPVAAEVKALDQEARGALRKHGVRFGQYTVFLPLLLKPAVTRLRLVLWSLWEGWDEFPESPPPGLVTIPHLPAIPALHYLLAGYRPAGERAIRIDMLERLADLIRAKDSRAGFEATPDMLSITGLTLEQFADLMAGLGYKATRDERPRVRPEAKAAASIETATVAATASVEDDGKTARDAPEAVAVAPPTVPVPDVVDADALVPAAAGEAMTDPTPPVAAPATVTSAEEPVTTDTMDKITTVTAPDEQAAPPVPTEGEVASAPAEPAPAESVETEAFYTFAWVPRPRHVRGPRHAGARPNARGDEAQDAAPQGRRRKRPAKGEGAAAAHHPPRKDDDKAGARPKGRPDRTKGGPRPRKSGGKRTDTGPRQYEARPPRSPRVDPDSPFAVLAALKTRD